MPETLNFHFTPVDTPRPDQDNPHAKSTTRRPVTPATPGVLTSEGGKIIAPEVLYNQDS